MIVFVISLCIVALGQPARVDWLCPIAATVGYALLFSSFAIESSRKRRFWLAALWFAAVQVIQLSWMTSIDYQGYYILGVYLFLCCVLGLQFGLFCALLPQERIRMRDIFAFAAFWTLLEWSRVLIACGFSWNPIGLALSFEVTALQCAALFGIFGLSFWVMCVNLCFFKAARAAQSALPWRKMAMVAVLLALAPYLFGALHLQYHRARMRDCSDVLRVVLVQTGLLPSEKVLMHGREEDYITPDEQWERILTYLQQEKACDLIALPEAVVPMHSDAPYCTLENARSLFAKAYGADVVRYFPKISYPFAENARVSNLFWAQTLANIYGADVVLGLDHADRSEKKYYNSAFLLAPEAITVQRYDKRLLLPLAEYIPWGWMRPWTKSYGIYDFFTQGEEGRILRGKHYLNTSICYEETFSHAIKKNTDSNTDLLLNVTNDAYFPHSTLAEQHFTHARARAVENGRPLLRSCNTGVTAVVDSLGSVVARFSQKGDEFKRGALPCALVLYKYFTLFSIWGNVGIVGISCLIVILYFYSRIFKESKE